jgi:hypothetical protein
MIATAATMIFTRRYGFLLLTLLIEHVYTQVFPNLLLGIDYPGISASCSTALNTTLTTCPSLLGSVSVDNPRLDSASLALLCTSGCQSELTSVRKTVASGCELASDIITYEDINYPGEDF